MMSLATVISWLQSKKVLLSLLLIIAAGAALRIYDLGAESLWLDEATSVKFSSGSVFSIITETSARNNPPLYWVMLHYWMGWFGDSEAAIRSLSAVWGILAIPLTYLVGRELSSRRVGLVASLFSAISCFHIYYSQEARPYGLLLFLSLLSYFFFIKILKEGKSWHYLCYFLTTFLLGYTHVYALFVIASQIFYFCLRWNKYQLQRKRLIITLVATIASLSPLVIMLGSKAMDVAEHGIWISEPSLSILYNTFAIYAGYGGWQTILLWVFSLLGIIGLFSIRRMGDKWVVKRPLESLKGLSWNISFESIEETLLLILWLSFPIVIPFVISKVGTPIYVFRYTIGASAAFYLLVARGLSIFKSKRVLGAILVVIIVLSSFGLHSYYVQDVKHQYREAANFIETNSGEGDVIVLCADYIRTPFDYYYQGDLAEFGISDQASEQELADFIYDVTYKKDRLWLVMAHVGQTAPIRSYLIARYGRSILLQRNFQGVYVVLFDLSTEGL